MVDEVKPIVYAEEYHEDKPSIFRESENLDRLLQAIFDICYQQQLDFLWLSQNLLNVDVAEKSHLDFIGNIVGQPRFLSDFNTEPYFGFDGSYQSKPFSSVTNPDIGGFWNSRSHFNTATARQLNDDEYRRLIKARAIYNQSNCTTNDLLEVINLLSNSKNNTVQMLNHGLIQINTDDTSGIISYFVDRLLNDDNILPIAAGVRVGLEEVVGNSGDGEGGTVEDNSNLIFSVESYNNPTNSYPLYIYIDAPQGDWVIMESGVVVADSSGFTAEWVDLEFDRDGGADIYFDISTPDIKHFESDVTASYMGIYYNGDNTEERESPLGEIIIKQFSSKIPEFSTQLFSTLLQVPQAIPHELVDINRLFIDAYLFNQDISMWDVSNVVNMNRMFEDAKSFNQDLSHWCVTNIASKPNNFDLDASQWTLPKPVWGTCPSGSGDGSGGGIPDTDWEVKKVYEGSTGSKVGIDAVRTKNNLEVESSIEVSPTVGQISDRIKSGEYGTEVSKAVLDIDANAVSWVLDPDNNQFNYRVTKTVYMSGTSPSTAQEAAEQYCSQAHAGSEPEYQSDYNGVYTYRCYSAAGKWVDSFTAFPVVLTTDEHISIDNVSAKVISNAEAGHEESKNLLVSVVSVLASMKFYDPLL